MPLGSLDGQGVGRYTESTPIPASFSAYLNLILENLSTVIAAVRDDTGWNTPTLGSGWSSVAGQTVQWRRYKGVIYLRGRPTGGASATPLFTLPVGSRPTVQHICVVNNGAATSGGGTRVIVETTGAVMAVVSTTPNLNDVASFIADA